jgi:hypothetical protein
VPDPVLFRSEEENKPLEESSVLEEYSDENN